MAQSTETLVHSDSGCCPCPNSSFETDLEGKSRTASSSSSGMESEDVVVGGCGTSNTTRSPKSSTSSYSSCNDTGEEVWNNFIFKPVQPEDYPKLLAHMRESFYRDEPLNATVGYSEGKADDMDAMITSYFKEGQGLSSIVLEKDTNKVAGARIIVIHRRHPTHGPVELKSIEMRKIMHFLDNLDEKAEIFNHYPGLEEYAELFMASVHSDFRGQGLAGEMYRGAIRLLQGKGFKLMKSCFTSPFTRIIGKKMGFRELAEAGFKEHRDEDGKVIFPNAKGDEVAVIAVLEI